MEAKQIHYVTLTERRGGARIWLEGLRLADCGFDRGQRYKTELDTVNATLTLTVCDAGPNKVSGRDRGGRSIPIIDICNTNIAKAFGGVDRVVVRYYAGQIVITLREIERRKHCAVRRLVDEVSSGTLSKGAFCAGAGISDRAIHEGIEQAGLLAKSEFLVDIEAPFLQIARDNSPALNIDTRLIVGSINELELSDLNAVSVLHVSLPCVGFSNSGKAVKGNTIPEADKKAGIAFLGLLRAVESMPEPPAYIAGENVEGWKGSVSELVVNARLEELGYTITEAVLSGDEFGVIENRNRHIWIASLVGEVAFSDLERPQKIAQILGDVLEPVPMDSDAWKPMSYLAEKEARDIEAGKGFRRQIVSPDQTSIGTIGAGYARIRGTEPHLKHPTIDGLYRLLTPVEHSRVKGIPQDHIADVNNSTLAHTVLGNSVVYPVFTALGKAIANHAKRFVTSQGGEVQLERGDNWDLFGFGAA